jgi:plastocyanin
MRRKRRLASGLIGACALVVSTLAASISAGASSDSRTYTIGVDNATPSQHNFEYVDYFPRGSVSESDTPTVIGNGSIVHFHWQGTGDSLHTATLLPSGMTPGQAWQAFPLVTLDVSDFVPGAPGPPPLAANNAVFFQNVACGTSAGTACHYDGSQLINSGARGNAGPPSSPDFYVQLNAPTSSPTTFHFVCLIHRGMQGAVTVVPGQGSSQTAVSDTAATQYASDTAGAFAAEAQASAAAAATNGIIAGTATPFVEVAEMLPRDASVSNGGQLTWTTQTIKDVHTVTFPQGPGSDSVDPFLPPICEAATGDIPLFFAGGAPCGNPANFEQPIDVAPHGGSTITSAVATSPVTSGIIANFPPFGNNVTFSFSEPGTFTYQCRIHDHMTGTITVTK